MSGRDRFLYGAGAGAVARRTYYSQRAEESGAMAEPVVAQKSPFAVDVQAGRSYWWCACGRSRNQPFCDGSHKGSEFSPIEFKADAAQKVFFCGCKNSGKRPMCDGTHNRL